MFAGTATSALLALILHADGTPFTLLANPLSPAVLAYDTASALFAIVHVPSVRARRTATTLLAATTRLAMALLPSMLADAATYIFFTSVSPPAMFADANATALLALALLPAMLAVVTACTSLAAAFLDSMFA
uniref:Uncharacterized protein n=1 Tax=Chrysotila carterae TaxID=13221 RepID=A0A7S4AZK3_CHRCT